MAKSPAAKTNASLLTLDQIAIRGTVRVGRLLRTLAGPGSAANNGLFWAPTARANRCSPWRFAAGCRCFAGKFIIISMPPPRMYFGTIHRPCFRHKSNASLPPVKAPFHQSRWHSGIAEGRQNVARFLSQASVEDINPFEVGARQPDLRRFRDNRRRFSHWLGIESLFRRKLISLSNGEQRKVLLVHTLLQSPRLLILDDPFGGLDAATRTRLKTVIHRLMRGGWPVLIITSRPDELPSPTTHLLLARNHRIIAQGTKRAMLQHPRAKALASSSFPGAAKYNEDGPASKGQVAKGHDVPLIEFKHVTVRHACWRILDDITWTMRRGATWASPGPNGSRQDHLVELDSRRQPAGL